MVIITVALKMTTIITSRVSTLPSKIVVIITVGFSGAPSGAGIGVGRRGCGSVGEGGLQEEGLREPKL